MTIEGEMPVEERLGALLDHLGIGRAHFAGRAVSELEPLCLARPEVVSSLTLVNTTIGAAGGLLFHFTGVCTTHSLWGRAQKKPPPPPPPYIYFWNSP
jgi:hypothetical protein